MSRFAVLMVIVSIANSTFAEGVLEVSAVPASPTVADGFAPKAPERAGSPAESKHATRDVEVRFRDGSIVRGHLKGIDQVALKTSFGTLKFPLEDLRVVMHGA